MKVIHKYPIPFGRGEYGRFEVETYREGKLLHVGMQGERACIWAEVDTDSGAEVERLQVLGTGDVVPDGAEHLATWLDGPFVWHLYALKGVV